MERNETDSILSSDYQINDLRENLECPNCNYPLENGYLPSGWTSVPTGLKFDPTDVELLDHLAAKCGIGNLEPHKFIDKFIATLEGEAGVCYTHPENLPGAKKDGSNAHYFYKVSNAHATGKRKRRRIQREKCLKNENFRWHKTGKTKPVMENGVKRGCKMILVLYTTPMKGSKSLKSNWVMHQYHLGTDDYEKEGEYVVSKVFYQRKKHAKKVDDSIIQDSNMEIVKINDQQYLLSETNRSKQELNMETIHSNWWSPKKGTADSHQLEVSDSCNVYLDYICRSPTQRTVFSNIGGESTTVINFAEFTPSSEEVEIIKGISHPYSSAAHSEIETESSWFAGLNHGHSSTCFAGDTNYVSEAGRSQSVGITDFENI